MILRLKLIILFVIIFLACRVEASPAKFYNVNTLFRISIRDANSVCKDNNGFIWASSKIGILRLTEEDYRVYDLPYESEAVITVKLVYRSPELIAYTNNGQIFSYNPVSDRFELVVNLRKLPNNIYFTINDLLIENDGAYLIATTNGLVKYRLGEITVIEGEPMDRCSMAWYDDQQFIFVRDDGIWLCDTKTGESVCKHRLNMDISSVSSLFYDRRENKLWIGTLTSGLYCYDLRLNSLNGVLNYKIPRQPILAIEEYNESAVLIGIDGQGVWAIAKGGDRVLNIFKEDVDDPYSLRGNGVYDIFCDEGKRVWVSTISGGVSFSRMASPLVNQIVHYPNDANSLVNNDINSVIEDRQGRLWFATNNGISCWEASTNTWKNFYHDKLEQAQVFLSLCEDDQGRIWAGSYSSGVYILDGETGRELAHYSRNEENSPIASDFIMNIFKDSQGDIWLGGVDGELVCYLSKENKFRGYSKMPIGSIGELADHKILLGSSYGLMTLDKENGENKLILSGFLVHDLLVRGEDIWICTGGNGLVRYKYKSGEKEIFNISSGLPSNFVNSIMSVNNLLWIGTENGICRLDLRDKSILTYSSILPLSAISFNNGARSRLSDGQLAWGTNNGVVVFDPDSLREAPTLPGKIYLQDLTISGRSIREIRSFKLKVPVDSLESVDLSYSQNTFSLELVPIGILPGSIFTWKLEGFDQEWAPPTSNRIVNYTNLPAGEYSLRIRLLNGSFSQVISERLITVRIIPPFWRRGWFLLLIVMVLSGVSFLYLFYYINRIERQHTEEKVRFFTNTAHEIRNSLTLIKAPVEELSRENGLSDRGKNYLRFATNQISQLSTVVTQLMDFQKVDIGKDQLTLKRVDIVHLVSNRCSMFDSYARSREVELFYFSNRQEFFTAVDEVKIEKVVDNLLSNAVKYSHPKSQVRIDLKCENSRWVLKVKDDGIGISRKAQRRLFKEFHRGENAINAKVVGSGLGLLLIKNYIALHGGKISCTSQEDTGSTFQVVIPYKETIIVDKQQEGPAMKIKKPITPMVEESPKQVVRETDSQHKEFKILIVEDNDDLLQFMCSALSDDFTIYTANDGAAAWPLILKKMPDMVVSDVMMPNMDGWELCQLVKSTFDTSHIPVLLLSALSEKAEQLKGLGLGADDYLTKPFDIHLLIQRIKTIISNREIVRNKALKLIGGNVSEPIMSNEHNDKFMKKVLEVVKDNIGNSEFGKEEFAFAMNVSSSLLYKKLKSLTDQSPSDFIKTIRLNRAMELLQSRKKTVTEVSELCGFASVAYFSTAFKKHFGKPPIEYLEG